ncbi:MAG: response regulator [Desulfobacula sp.]|nr:response regulator [Desulfobacula sp.]
MNLCTNAYHAMKETGGQLSITLAQVEIKKRNMISRSNIKPGSYLKLEISDTGVGMKPEVLSKIFEPYFTTKKMSEGTGLGLAVVLGIIEEHNGYIKVASKPGKGSSFTVYLPVFVDESGPDFLNETQESIKGGTETIMIVDDEESVLSSSSELIADYGYKVKAFLDVKNAFKAFEQNKFGFDLIITDMTMPNMTGDDFAKKVLSIRDNIPIVLCTGYSNKMSKEKALKLGIKKYFQKPLEAKEMLHSIRKILDEG